MTNIRRLVIGTACTGKFTLPSDLAFVDEYTLLLLALLVQKSLHCHIKSCICLRKIQTVVTKTVTAGTGKCTLPSTIAFVDKYAKIVVIGTAGTGKFT